MHEINLPTHIPCAVITIFITKDFLLAAATTCAVNTCINIVLHSCVVSESSERREQPKLRSMGVFNILK